MSKRALYNSVSGGLLVRPPVSEQKDKGQQVLSIPLGTHHLLHSVDWPGVGAGWEQGVGSLAAARSPLHPLLLQSLISWCNVTSAKNIVKRQDQ